LLSQQISEITSSESKIVDGKPVPFVYKCHHGNASLEDVCKWTTEHQKEIEDRLAEHGAVLFRGFPFKGAECFDKFVCSFEGWKDLA